MKTKIIAGAIVLATLSSTLTPYIAQAKENEKTIVSQKEEKGKVQHYKDSNIEFSTQILLDNNEVRKVKVVTPEGTTISQFNKITGEVITTDDNNETSVINIDNIDTQEIDNTESITPKISTYQTATSLTEIYSQTDAAYHSKCVVAKYKFVNPTETKYSWNIATSKSTYTTVWETSKNSSDLESFKSAVKATVGHQIEAAAAAGATYAAGLAALLSAAPTAGLGTVVALITAVGTGTAGAVALYYMREAHKDAVYYYNRIV